MEKFIWTRLSNRTTPMPVIENNSKCVLSIVVEPKGKLKCGKEQCTCYGLEEAWDCPKDCENPIW